MTIGRLPAACGPGASNVGRSFQCAASSTANVAFALLVPAISAALDVIRKPARPISNVLPSQYSGRSWKNCETGCGSVPMSPSRRPRWPLAPP
jgi:hypothetical protein